MAAYSNLNAPVTRLDAIVIGAGVAGLYQLHKLRGLGLNVRAYETGSGVGGTWYWNRYPGARFDSQAEIYQYWFSEDLYKSWKPSERFPAQPETEGWLNWVADRLDLRKDIRFGARTRHEPTHQGTFIMNKLTTLAFVALSFVGSRSSTISLAFNERRRCTV